MGVKTIACALALWAATVTTAGDVVASDATDRLARLVAHRNDIVDGFAEQVRMCVSRRDTHHDVFHGCIDWHSSVHGFWALTAAARLTGRTDLADFVRDRLSQEGIALERDMIARRPRFEMPYGRAWFLRLALEFERAFGDERLRAMADEVAVSLQKWLGAFAVDPDSLSYESQSWALINLRAWGRHTGRDDIVAFVDDIVEARFVPYAGPCRGARDEARRSFMAGCTNRAWLVSEVLGDAEFKDWLAGFLPDPDTIAPVVRPANAHLYGLDFSRAWGLWRLYRKTGDTRYLDLYVDHFTTAQGNDQWWRGDYGAVGHWVSQFGMFAATILFEPDYY